jgi:hypothetical protein
MRRRFFMKKYFAYVVISLVLIGGAIAYTGVGGVDMASNPRGGIIILDEKL